MKRLSTSPARAAVVVTTSKMKFSMPAHTYMFHTQDYAVVGESKVRKTKNKKTE